MASYLVTGGAGFIGSHVVEALLEEGHRVRVIDNFSTGGRDRIPQGVECIEADLVDLDASLPAFRGIDGVFHLAALARIPFSMKFPRESNAANVTGTLHVLEAARQCGVRRIVYSASSSAYGDQPTMPLREDMPAKPLNPYGLQKYVGEEYCRVYAGCHGLETVSLRYFNVYGPRMSMEGAYVTIMSVFLRQRQAGEPFTIVGDGEQTRDFTHVRDVVRANILAMRAPNVGRGEVMNIGAGKNQSVNTIARLMGGLDYPKTYLPERIEARHTLADNRRARELIGWEPREDFDAAVQEILGLHGLSVSTSTPQLQAA